MIPNERYYCSLLIQIIDRECNEALEAPLKKGNPPRPLPESVRVNLKNMLAEASKAKVRLKELADDDWVKEKLEERR